jgi:hypothetical protein
MPTTVVKLERSDREDKKFKVSVRGRIVHFGQAGASDYTLHKDPERKQRYIDRHKDRENWTKGGIQTAGFWSRWLLWEKPSIRDAKRNISRQFDVVFI